MKPSLDEMDVDEESDSESESSNLDLTTRTTNKMKANLSEDETLERIQKITEKEYIQHFSLDDMGDEKHVEMILEDTFLNDNWILCSSEDGLYWMFCNFSLNNYQVIYVL